jgi:hypothetical protein
MEVFDIQIYFCRSLISVAEINNLANVIVAKNNNIQCMEAQIPDKIKLKVESGVTEE